jgi:hypothetical protein
VEALEAELMTQFVAISKATGILSIGIYLFMRFAHSWKWVSKTAWYARISPALPPALGVLGAFGGGVVFDKPPSLAMTVIYGLIAAYGAEKGRKLLGQSVLGDDKRITKGKQ